MDDLLRLKPWLPRLLVLIGKLLCLADHLLDLLLGQPAFVVCDRDLLALASTLVFGAHIQDAVAVLGRCRSTSGRGKVGSEFQ